MDVAYDHIQEEVIKEDGQAQQEQEHDKSDGAGQSAQPQARRQSNLNAEFKESFRAVAETSWGAKLGGFWGSVRKQGESYYESASKELSSASAASKGFLDPAILTGPAKDVTAEDREATERVKAAAPQDVPESLTDDIVKEARSMFSSFRSEASTTAAKVQNSASVQQLARAEEAADEALLKFGATLRNYLRDAVKITAPEGPDGQGVRSVLFESRDVEGRRVVHATRFDAQLHVIHSTLSNFTHDPVSEQYPAWFTGFEVGGKTDAIAADLERYEELRRAMEALVPEKVEYAAFWARYYFLRHVIEVEEQKRRELLSQAATEEVGWDDDEEDEQASTPKKEEGTPAAKDLETRAGHLLKPRGGRNSNDHSVADSEASYDIVSGQVSGQGSPKESAKKAGGKAEESDEEDWE